MSEAIRERAIQLAGEVVVGDQPGRVIRAAREHHGFTQAWLAEHLDVRRESLSRIESGRSSPTLRVVDRFARVIALARHVRQAAARAETGKGTPEPGTFTAAGRRVGLTPDEAEAIAAEAIEAYEAKRRSLLEEVDGRDTGGSSR